VTDRGRILHRPGKRDDQQSWALSRKKGLTPCREGAKSDESRIPHAGDRIRY
jgi:hypothetical protein